jgi:para-aminobenzoate synthetase component 1
MRAHHDEQENTGASIQAVAFRDPKWRFSRIAAEPGAVWLDSSKPDFARANFDIIASRPSKTSLIDSVAADGSYTIDGAGGGQRDIFARIQGLHRPMAPPRGVDLPFYGGVLGYLGYDLNRSLERLSPAPPAPGPVPLAWLGYYPWALVQNIASREAWLVADSPRSLESGRAWLAAMDEGSPLPARFHLRSEWQASTSAEQYRQSVEGIQRLILAGDCYQVNLAQHFAARYSGHPWGAYCQLRERLPAPFSAFINAGPGFLLSHSPERFVCIDDRHISTSPIKGTRPRGKSVASDARYVRELLSSTKDRAENLMIVDLLRNDLGRSCRPGSIGADSLFALESYANVHHLVSTIHGELRSDVTPLEALRSAFPGGSITGAPKIRAMDIINAYEPVSRGAYCGCVFYYSNHGRLDSNIAIRSLMTDGTRIHCWGGGGIVADSNPREEYEESLNKIALLLEALSALRA